MLFLQKTLIVPSEIFSKTRFWTTWCWLHSYIARINETYNNQIRSSIRLTPIQAAYKNNDGYVHHNLLDKRKKVKPKFIFHDLVETAHLKRAFSKGGSANWLYEKYEFIGINNDTIPRNRIDKLPDRFYEVLLKESELSIKKNNDIMKNLIVS